MEKCVICGFLLNLQIQNAQLQSNKMIYFDFLIRKENKFLRNIFERDELQSCKTLTSLHSYCNVHKIVIHVSIFLQDDNKSMTIVLKNVYIVNYPECKDFQKFEKFEVELKSKVVFQKE